MSRCLVSVTLSAYLFGLTKNLGSEVPGNDEEAGYQDERERCCRDDCGASGVAAIGRRGIRVKEVVGVGHTLTVRSSAARLRVPVRGRNVRGSTVGSGL